MGICFVLHFLLLLSVGLVCLNPGSIQNFTNFFITQIAFTFVFKVFVEIENPIAQQFKSVLKS